MADKPLLVKPEPTQYIKVDNEIKFTKDTHDKIQAYLDWNPSCDGANDLNFLLEGAVNFLFEHDKAFTKHLKQKSKPTRKRTTKVTPQANTENNERLETEFNIQS
jgi:hypothetical protein